MTTAPPPAGTTPHSLQPSAPEQCDLISGLWADRVIPWLARTSREALLMERASIGRSLISEADAAQSSGRRASMDPAALRELLICRGYIQVSHQRADGLDEWFDLDGKAGSIRVVTHPGDGYEIELLGLGPKPAGLVCIRYPAI